MDNPFKYGGVVKGPYFADRQDELAEIAQEMHNLGRVFLVSPRRFGKTCLLFNLMDKLRAEGLATVYIDLNAHPDIRSLAGAVASQVARVLESNTDRLMKLLAGFRHLRPKVGVGPDGSLAAGVEVAVSEQNAVAALLEGMAQAENLAARKGQKLVIVIDEFSDIAKYDGQTLEKALRSEIQKHGHVAYLMSGSEQSVILAMVRDRKRAFYKLGRIMQLGPIDRAVYTAFILEWFESKEYKVLPKDLQQIFILGKDVPHNIQRLCHILWEKARSSRRVTLDMIAQLPAVIARQDSPHYELLWRTATQGQKALLIALSREPEARPFSKEFQFRHSIGPASSIKASLDSLVKKGIIFRTLAGAYRFSDTFMPYWIASIRA